MHKIDGWENLIQDEIIVEASSPCKNCLVINVNDVEKYDLAYENHVLTKNKYMKNGKPIHNAFENMMGTFHMNIFFLQMKKLNEGQKKLWMIIYTKKKPIKTFTLLFTKRCKDKKNIHINVHYTNVCYNIT
jgi:hypothetical protein